MKLQRTVTKQEEKMVLPSACPSAGQSPETPRNKEAQRRTKAHCQILKRFSRNAHQHLKWPKFLNLISESSKNILKNQKVHQQMSKRYRNSYENTSVQRQF